MRATTTNRRRFARAGFTLIELTIAILILSVGCSQA